VYIRSSAEITAGSVIGYARKNGSNIGSGVTLNSGTFAERNELPQGYPFAQGDMIQAVYYAAGLVPAGSADIDLCVLVVF
jgi:hypothetical protein